MSVFEGIPWSFYLLGSTRFWVHYGLVILGFVIALITVIVQKASPAPYGKHDGQDKNWGPQIPQRLGHILSDGVPGVLMFILVFFLYGSVRGPVNYVFLTLFLSHYVQRGIIHPLIMRYKSTTVSLGITLGGFFPNCLFHFINADFIGNALFDVDYFYDPRFIIGALLFIIGYIINRWADFKLRSLRKMKGENQFVADTSHSTLQSSSSGYYVPYGGLFEVVSCPNYLGELTEWIGWSLLTWSAAGVVWALFSAATFIPRSYHNHQWYKQQFEMYPPNRKALIPYIF